MKIIKEQSKYHLYAFEFGFSFDVLDFCRELKNEFGWQSFSFFEKKWRFNDPAIITKIKEKYEDVEIEEGLIELSKEEQLKQELQKIKEQKLEDIKTDENRISTLKIPGFKGEPFNYQKLGIEFFNTTNGKAILGDEPGLGKSIQTLGYIVYNKIPKTLIVSPASVKWSWYSEVEKWTNLKAIVIDSKYNITIKTFNENDIIIINYDILEKFFEFLSTVRFDLMVIDEFQYCFPYDTLIETNMGRIKIGDIVEKKINLSVASCNILTNDIEYKKVINYFKLENNEKLIKVTHQYGEFICTKDHKIYTNSGYKKAISLSSGEELRMLQENIFDKKEGKGDGKILFPTLCGHNYESTSTSPNSPTQNESRKTNKKMSSMWKRIYSYEKSQRKFKKTFLWKKLFCKMENKFTRSKGTCERNYKNSPKVKYWKKKSKNIKSNDRKKQRSYIQKENNGWIQKMEERLFWNAIRARRKWPHNYSSKNSFRTIELSNRIFNKNIYSKNKIQKYTESLLGRFSRSKSKVSYRSRWNKPHNTKKQNTRQEKRSSIKISRVVSIEVLEQGNIRRPTKSSGKNKFVYNIEVKENNNYFAEKILVSNCKSNAAKRTKLTKALSRNIPKVILLSGTPILNKPVELFNALNIVDQKEWSDWYKYTRRYCGGHMGQWGYESNGSTNIEELREKIQKYFLRRKKSDVLKELPPKINIDYPVELSSDKKFEYDLAMDSFIEYLKNIKDKTDKEIQKTVQAEQITKLNELRVISTSGKISATKELINNIIENDEKVIVFSNFNKPIEELHEEFKDISVLLTGQTPEFLRKDAIERFQKDDTIKIFFGGIVSAGVGITLTKASNVIFMDINWVPAVHIQASDRAQRIGSTAKVINVYWIIAKDTIDEKMRKILEEKQKIFDKLFENNLIEKQESTNITNDLIKDIKNNNNI